MATTPKTETATSTLEQAALVIQSNENKAAPLKEGETFRFNAPNGALYHPWDGTVFDVTSETKHVVDGWINLQFTAGKLVLAVE